MTGRTLAGWLALLPLVATLAGCSDAPQISSRQERKEFAVKHFREGKDIHLGVVWDKDKAEFFSGATLAAEEIDAEGGVAGRRLVLDFTDEAAFMETRAVNRTRAEGRFRNAVAEAGTELAKAVVANPDITAVIGHRNEDATLSAMLTYQENGVLLFSGASTDARLNWSGNAHYFQLRPQDQVLVQKMASSLKQHKWSTTYVIYEMNRHNEQVLELLKTEFAKQKIQLVGTVAIMLDVEKSADGSRRLQSALNEMGDGSVDAIVLLASPKLGAQVMAQSRAQGILQPFFGTGALESDAFINTIGPQGAGTLVTSLMRSDSYLVQRFSERFKKRFPDLEPNEAAVMGYDSVRLYAEAVASANTIDPVLVSNALHYKIDIWYGLLGAYSFENAKTKSLKYYIRKLVSGKDGKLTFVHEEDPA